MLIALFVAMLGVWIGSVLFYSGVVLPLLFTSLERSEAGNVAALIFPYYYWVGSAAGVVLTSVIAVMARAGGRWWRASAAAAVVMLACQLYAAFVVHPGMAEVRGVEALAARFDQLHHLSVRLNSVVLLGGVLLMGGSGLLLRQR